MTSAKIDFKRELSELYRPTREPELIEVPDLAFLMIDGHGDPNTSGDYRDAIATLFSIAFTLKFAFKRTPGGFDYGVMPLEGLWWGADDVDVVTTDKSTWSWTAMIMQPDEITAPMVADAVVAAAHKRTVPASDKLRLERFCEGLSAQLMYIGPYADELPAIRRLHAFIAERDCEPVGKHHEIYLGDPRRSAPDKLRTIIRQPVARG
ncbi:MAG TPA: GyrI-like domain-containing protein [Solirubrobacteraceae bacterium]|nr:GyrI-like domain-containing protein [Solirubrobacteraceae bacterium]